MKLTKKVISSIRRYAQNTEQMDKLDRALNRLEKLVEVMGEHSSSQQTQKRLAKLLFADKPHFVTVCCPDYSHSEGDYTLKSVGSDVSLLAKKNIEFTRKINEFMELELTVIYADSVSRDFFLLDKINSSTEDILNKLEMSIQKTNTILSDIGACKILSLSIQNFYEKVSTAKLNLKNRMKSDKKLFNSIKESAFFRSGMYDRLGVPYDKREDRILNTRAQYTVLAEWAKLTGVILIDHSTANFAAFREAEIGFLHNPIEKY